MQLQQGHYSRRYLQFIFAPAVCLQVAVKKDADGCRCSGRRQQRGMARASATPRKRTRVAGTPELRCIAEKEMVGLQERVGDAVTRVSATTGMDELLDRVATLKQREIDNYLEVCALRLDTNHRGPMKATMEAARDITATLNAIIRKSEA
jgi:hypothetical protein